MIPKNILSAFGELNASGTSLCGVCKFKKTCEEQCLEARVTSAESLCEYLLIQDKDALIAQLILSLVAANDSYNKEEEKWRLQESRYPEQRPLSL